MGKPKKYDIRSINFGGAGHPARILVEKYVKDHGKVALSDLIRTLVVSYLADKPEYKEWKKDFLIYQYKGYMDQIRQLVEARQVTEKNLKKFGVDPYDIIDSKKEEEKNVRNRKKQN